MTHYRQYLQADMENDEEFYKGDIPIFYNETLVNFYKRKRICL
jgi:hypothetical protein